MDDIVAKIIGGGIALIAIAILLPVLMLYQAWSVWMLWGWFVVPLGAPPIGLAWAYGLVLFWHSSRIGGLRVKSEYLDAKWTNIVGVFAQPLLAVCMGYVVKGLM